MATVPPAVQVQLDQVVPPSTWRVYYKEQFLEVDPSLEYTVEAIDNQITNTQGGSSDLFTYVSVGQLVQQAQQAAQQSGVSLYLFMIYQQYSGGPQNVYRTLFVGA